MDANPTALTRSCMRITGSRKRFAPCANGNDQKTMNSFAALGVLALLVVSIATPVVAQTTDSPNPPAATMPPEPVAPSSPLAPLNPRRRQSLPHQPVVRTMQGATVTHAPTVHAPTVHAASRPATVPRAPIVQHAVAPAKLR